MFMRLILIGLMWISSTAVWAQSDIRAEFNARHLTQQEKRVLQAALAFEGHYQGLLDGAWGKGSQSALLKMVKARGGASYVSWEHALDLEERLRKELEAQGWRPVQSQGVSFLAPMDVLSPDSARRGTALVSRPKGLQIRVMPQTIAEALTLANAVTSRHAGRDKPYQSLNDKRLVVSAALENGGGIYMRTNDVGGQLVTALVEWNKPHASRAQLMLSSIRKGEQANLDLPWDGVLSKLARTAALKPVESAPKPRKEDNVSGFWPTEEDDTTPDALPKRKGRVSGNAFFINNTDLITAAHVVQGCRSISLQGLGRARIVSIDPARNLALIASEKRSTDWVDISRAHPDRGDGLIVVGFASKTDDRQKFFAHSVNVNKRAAAAGETGKVALKNNVPNADHGSIVLDFDRKLAGLIIRHPNPTRKNRYTYMASAMNLRAFLRENNVMFSRGERNGPRPMTEDGLKSTVWRVACQGR